VAKISTWKLQWGVWCSWRESFLWAWTCCRYTRL